MAQSDYETLFYKVKLNRTLKRVLLLLILCIVILAPILWIWNQTVLERRTLRDAKNVVMNMNLLAIESFGFDEDIVDSNETSGLSKAAEERIRNYAGVEGIIHLTSWDIKNNCVTGMSYKSERWLVEYNYDPKTDEKTWNVYWNIKQYGD